jgi:hypothetical protein
VPSDCEDVVAGFGHIIFLDTEGRLLKIDIKCLKECKLVGASGTSLSEGIALLNEASGRVRDLEGHISTLVRYETRPGFQGRRRPCVDAS